MHYPRGTPDQWPKVLKQATQQGLNTIQTYVFWSVHEPSEGEYDFTPGTRSDLAGFLQSCADAGLFVHIRLGPYACAEWNLGGIPSWLRFKQDMVFRTNNTAWLAAVTSFLDRVMEEIEPFLARNGGPIIIAQIENEYGNVEAAYGAGGQEYVLEMANLATSYDLDIPWVMCQQPDAPQEIINTCNGFYCDAWIANHTIRNPGQPHMWTENWNSWFQKYGDPKPLRPIYDDLYAIARFIMKGGTFHNYYMFHGGTNFGRSVGGPMIITSYDYGAALDEYGMQNPLSFNQSRTLHMWLTTYSDLILGTSVVPPATPLGPAVESVTYSLDGASVTFIANTGETNASVEWPSGSGVTIDIPAWSVSIVDDGIDTPPRVQFNTAIGPFIGQHQKKVTSTPAAGRRHRPKNTPIDIDDEQHIMHRTIHDTTATAADSKRPIAASGDAAYHCAPEAFGLWNLSSVITSPTPLPQIATTRDTTDYLFYVFDVPITAANILTFKYVALSVSNVGDVWLVELQQESRLHPGSLVRTHAFINSAIGSEPAKIIFQLNDGEGWYVGQAQLVIMSQTMGLQNYGTFLESRNHTHTNKNRANRNDCSS